MEKLQLSPASSVNQGEKLLLLWMGICRTMQKNPKFLEKLDEFDMVSGRKSKGHDPVSKTLLSL